MVKKLVTVKFHEWRRPYTVELDVDESTSEARIKGLAFEAVVASSSLASCTKIIAGDMSGLNFASLDFRRCVMDGCDFSGCVMDGCNLTEVTFRRCNLRSASFRDANLAGAGFYSAGFYNCSASDVDLRGAELRGLTVVASDLSGAKLPDYQIDQGTDLVVWKAVRSTSGVGVAKLVVPAAAKRTASLVGRKCRAEWAVVLEAPYGAVSDHDASFRYVAGETVVPDGYDSNPWLECTRGIHFFIERSDAESYLVS